ncbi:hypothetical protein SETIT_2G229800v2 [Setaria italica]|uniref:Uncharacterized protein n=1 Tax=Setaria italica TaxID=4555 RepID=A0A368Q225_SETIT|nr:hypothetical protein SETIT_2G229800v2 [Setaria italica]
MTRQGVAEQGNVRACGGVAAVSGSLVDAVAHDLPRSSSFGVDTFTFHSSACTASVACRRWEPGTLAPGIARARGWEPNDVQLPVVLFDGDGERECGDACGSSTLLAMNMARSILQFRGLRPRRVSSVVLQYVFLPISHHCFWESCFCSFS